ncbi:hypothetical protein [Streptomyces sp. NPDC054834]
MALGLVAFVFEPVLGLLFFAAHAVYFWREIRNSHEEESQEEELEPLKFQPKATSPATWAVVAQTLVTLAVIFFASQLFVKQLDAIGPMFGLSASVTALLLSPIVTELPEVRMHVLLVAQSATARALGGPESASKGRGPVQTHKPPAPADFLTNAWSTTRPAVTPAADPAPTSAAG